MPADATQRLQNAINLSGGPPPTLEVIYNVEDPLKAQIVEATVKARLADANQALTNELTKLAAQYLQILLKGGQFNLLGQNFDVLGLQRSKVALEAAAKKLPPGSLAGQAGRAR